MLRYLQLTLLILLVAIVYIARLPIETTWQQLRLANSSVTTELLSQKYIDKIPQNSTLDESATNGVWFNKKVSVPTNYLTKLLSSEESSVVLGQNSEEKWIDINLDNQTLTAFEGTRPVYNFMISSGLPWMPTVTGEFHLWAKVRSQRMTGGSKENGTYYDLPNVPYVQYFHGGYGIHGAYWHTDFGKPRSHGCVNLSPSDAQKLFEWTNPPLEQGKWANYKIKPEEGTRVVIHGKATL